MRVNVYAEDGQAFLGVRFYLELPCTIPMPAGGVTIHRGPFIHRPGDDDSSAVTFWGKQDLRAILRKALNLLDAHYESRKVPDGKPE